MRQLNFAHLTRVIFFKSVIHLEDIPKTLQRHTIGLPKSLKQNPKTTQRTYQAKVQNKKCPRTPLNHTTKRSKTHTNNPQTHQNMPKYAQKQQAQSRQKPKNNPHNQKPLKLRLSTFKKYLLFHHFLTKAPNFTKTPQRKTTSKTNKHTKNVTHKK